MMFNTMLMGVSLDFCLGDKIGITYDPGKWVNIVNIKINQQ